MGIFLPIISRSWHQSHRKIWRWAFVNCILQSHSVTNSNVLINVFLFKEAGHVAKRIWKLKVSPNPRGYCDPHAEFVTEIGSVFTPMDLLLNKQDWPFLVTKQLFFFKIS